VFIITDDKATTPDTTPANKLCIISSCILAITGLLLSSYLFYQHYLIINEANGKADVCYAVFGKGCTRALASSVAVQMGLPLAGWGIIYYTILLAVLSLRVFFNLNNRGASIVLTIITAIGCTGSIILLGMIYFDHSLFCPFCVMIHGINILLFVCSIILLYSSGFFKSPRKFSFTAKFSNANIKLASGFIFLVIGMYTILYLILTPGKIIFDTQKFIAGFENTSQQQIAIDGDDPVSGPMEAPAQLIVFSDFQCAACRNFSKVSGELQKKYPGKLQVVFKNFPLGKQCNPIYGEYDLHPKACDAARAAEAARLQQKFWQYHDLLFSINLETSKEIFSSLAEKAGLNQAQFEKDRRGDIVITSLAKTISQGNQLGLKGTPAVFLNGKMVSDFRSKHMQVLLGHILKSAEEKNK
jgi:protein-disulfide isomerase/uncharacterized membrane protein